MAAFILLLLVGASMPHAAETTRGIGGTGHSAIGSGMGGTGNSDNKAGIGGTGHTGGGIGGTGISAKAGIGGTGHSDGGIGGTGIVGTITGFGSIWVNGLEVQYDPQTQGVQELAVGQVVVIEAKGDNNMLQANKISVINAAEGQISTLNGDQNKILLLGQNINITAQTIVHDRQNNAIPAKLQQGDYIQVSGLRLPNGDIVASYIERNSQRSATSLVGPITAIKGDEIEVYGLKIRNTNSKSLSVGQEIQAKGQMQGDILVASEMTASASAQLYSRTEHINLQGYVGEGSKAGQIRVGGLEVLISDSALKSDHKLDALIPGELVQISGRFDNEHRIVVDRIDFSRDRPERIQLNNTGRGDLHGVEKVEREQHDDKPDRSEHVERPDQPDRSDHSDAEKKSEHSN